MDLCFYCHHIDGYCGRPEWADIFGCPFDNPDEGVEDCLECPWFVEVD